MHDSMIKRPSRVRRAVVLLALAGLAIAAFAMFPGGASAGAQPISLTVNVTGTGDGSMTGTADTSGGPLQINCQKNGGLITGCGQNSLADNNGQVVVSLTATPIGANSSFTGWQVSGNGFYTDECGTDINCDITIYTAGAQVSVSAGFSTSPTGFGLTVNRIGNAATSGAVTSVPPGISCQPQVQTPVCAAVFDNGTLVTLTATPATGTTFDTWGGSCAIFGVNPTCIVNMTQARAATATFSDQEFALSVSITGVGGVVSNVQPGLNCYSGTNTGCTANFAEGTAVQLTATAGPGMSFTGWSGGGCTGTATCTVTVNGATSVQATFAATEVQASVTGNSVRCTGPRPARRQLRITIDAQQAITGVIRLRNAAGVTVQRRNFSEEEADVFQVTMNIGNGKKNGRYTAQVTMTNDFGASKVETRNVKLKTCR